MKPLRTINFIIKHPLNRGNKVRAILDFMKWQIGSRLVPGEVIYHWINDSKFIVQPGERGLTQNMYCGLMEFHEMSYVLHVLNSDDLFVDIGANVGSYTILACAVRGARGYCFEPAPVTFQRLMNNIKINELSERVKAYNIGLADREGELFFTAGLNCTNHVITEGESFVDAIKVNVQPLDAVLAGEAPSLIKIDVEGLETRVINGMLHTLENPSLHSIIMELNGSGTRYGFDDKFLMNTMLEFGFRMYTYEPFERILKPVSKEILEKAFELNSEANYGSGNLLFLRNEDFIKQRISQAASVKIGAWEI